MSDFFLSVLMISLSTSAIILLVLLLTQVCRRLSAGSVCLVWTLILLRLCIPAGLTYNLLPSEYAASMAMQEVTEPVSAQPQYDTAPVYEADESGQIQMSTTIMATEPSGIVRRSVDWTTVVAWLWLIVGAAYFASGLAASGNAVQRFCRNARPVGEREYAFAKAEAARWKLRRVPDILISGEIGSPMLCGFLHPRILLPEIDYDDDTLRAVLSHELCHERRGDLWRRLAGLAAVSLHWFNPLAHLAFARLSQTAELACDAAVLDGADAETRRRYGRMMYDILDQRSRRGTLLSTQFHSDGKSLKVRFAGILDTRPKRGGWWMTAIVAALCIAVGSTLGCMADVRAPIFPNMSREAVNIAVPLDYQPAGFEVTPTAASLYASPYWNEYEDKAFAWSVDGGLVYHYGRILSGGSWYTEVVFQSEDECYLLYQAITDEQMAAIRHIRVEAFSDLFGYGGFYVRIEAPDHTEYRFYTISDDVPTMFGQFPDFDVENARSVKFVGDLDGDHVGDLVTEYEIYTRRGGMIMKADYKTPMKNVFAGEKYRNITFTLDAMNNDLYFLASSESEKDDDGSYEMYYYYGMPDRDAMIFTGKESTRMDLNREYKVSDKAWRLYNTMKNGMLTLECTDGRKYEYDATKMAEMENFLITWTLGGEIHAVISGDGRYAAIVCETTTNGTIERGVTYIDLESGEILAECEDFTLAV